MDAALPAGFRNPLTPLPAGDGRVWVEPPGRPGELSSSRDPIHTTITTHPHHRHRHTLTILCMLARELTGLPHLLTYVTLSPPSPPPHPPSTSTSPLCVLNMCPPLYPPSTAPSLRTAGRDRYCRGCGLADLRRALRLLRDDPGEASAAVERDMGRGVQGFGHGDLCRGPREARDR